MRLFPVFIFFTLWLPVCRLQARETAAVDTITPMAPDRETERNAFFVVDDIRLSGNNKTRGFIVMREVPFKKGDSFTGQELDRQMELTRQQLMNTLLFVDVSVYIAARKGNALLINIDMKERWYIFPLPYFRLADRNFNQWWVDQKRSLDRVNYGVKFIQNNVSGHNDNLDIWLITGYTQQITLRYDIPFADRKLKSGFNVGFVYATQKELNYETGNNKQLFYKQEETIRKSTRFDLTYSYRPGVKHRHYFRVSFNDESVADTVLKLNPLYYPEGSNRVRYFDLSYQYKYYNVDYVSYPSKGFLLDAGLYKRGLDQLSGLWLANARAVYAVPLTSRSFLHFETVAALKLPFNNYFFNQRLVGYGYFQMRGLEYNVVDGMAGAVFKTTAHRELLQFVLKNPIRSKTHDKIPFRIFLKAYGDLGYTYNSNPGITNTLSNKLLRTWGIGMDIVSVYDFVFKIEYSFNQLGRDGLYLQSRNDF